MIFVHIQLLKTMTLILMNEYLVVKYKVLTKISLFYSMLTMTSIYFSIIKILICNIEIPTTHHIANFCDYKKIHI